MVSLTTNLALDNLIASDIDEVDRNITTREACGKRPKASWVCGFVEASISGSVLICGFDRQLLKVGVYTNPHATCLPNELLRHEVLGDRLFEHCSGLLTTALGAVQIVVFELQAESVIGNLAVLLAVLAL